MDHRLLAFHPSIVGYALFLVVNATQVWGGVFPFLPRDFQTETVTLTFYLSQSLAFCAAFALSTLGSYLFPRATRSMRIVPVCALAFLGSCAVIAAMYAPHATLALVVAGGTLLGTGTAGLFMLWQRYFSSIDADAGNFRLIAGTILASAAYFALHAIPVALTAFLVPLVLVPLCGLCLVLSAREMHLDQPMFEDVPREHPQVYAHLFKDFWRTMVGVAALAFASGLARGVAVIDVDEYDLVNIASMAGALLGAGTLLVCWLRTSFRFSLQSLFRIAYPVVATGLALFPFLSTWGLDLFAALGYLVFSLVILLVMMQCAQISRDRGTNPVFSYGMFGSAVYIAQAGGFLFGWFAHDIEVRGVGQSAFLSIATAWVLGMALFVSTGRLVRRRTAEPSGMGVAVLPIGERRSDQIEFLSPLVGGRVAERQAKNAGDSDAGAPGDVGGKPAGNGESLVGFDAGGRTLVDRLSKQCLVLQGRYLLSTRETEVMELIARGYGAGSIAEELFISENTVRTHSRHLYAKLGIHSRQELGQMLREVKV